MNDNEIKARLFALYWGREVFMYTQPPVCTGLVTAVGLMFLDKHPESYCLLLRPLSSITDQEKKEMMRLHRPLSTVVDIGRLMLPLSDGYIHDYLRSIGIARPFMGITVSEQVEKGWIKIK